MSGLRDLDAPARVREGERPNGCALKADQCSRAEGANTLDTSGAHSRPDSSETVGVTKVGSLTLDLRMDQTLAATVTRIIAGRTALDASVDDLPMVESPRWLVIIIRMLRWYRSVRPTAFGARCVFDPSCSRYSEMAFRQRGFIRGVSMTLRRLHRCRPGAGGVDTSGIDCWG